MRYKQDLTEEEQKILQLYLLELKNRGIPLPDEAYKKKQLKWPKDSNGYFTKNGGQFFVPSDHQERFLESIARYIALISGRGGGKSAAGSQKAIKKIEQGLSGIVYNPDFENFKSSTWPEFREWIPWDMVVPGQRYRRNPEWEAHEPFTMVFLNEDITGSGKVRVRCKGLKDPDSGRGPNVNWFWYDEGGRDRDGQSWRIAEASVRLPPDPQSWVTTTPKGRNHWIYKFFVKQEIPEDAKKLFEEQGGGRELIEVFDEMTIYDNIQNLDPGFVAAMLAAYPVGWQRDQEIFGKFVDQTGSIGDRTWFNGKILPTVPEAVMKRLVYWDLAGSAKKTSGKKAQDPDWFVKTKLSIFEEKPVLKFCIEHQFAIQRPDWGDFKRIFAEQAERDGITVPVYVEEEPGGGGINQVEELKLYIKEKLGVAYKVEGHNPKKFGDKVMRANPWFAEAANGQIYMVEGNWNEEFLEQFSGFPDNVDHDDRIDSMSGARLAIAPFKTWKDVGFLSL